MKSTYWLPIILLLACTTKEHKNEALENTVYKATVDSIDLIGEDSIKPTLTPKIYGNGRFRNVTVEKVGANLYRVIGQGQIFEASFNWVVEDGHEELKKGFQMTDAGAPEWGDFDFMVEIQKVRANSTLTLLLFETSAKDGSRQYELPIVLK